MTKDKIIDYFDEYIFGFISADIEKDIKAGANYLVALGLLSYTEFIGSLITGELGKNSESNFNTFVEKYLKYKYDDDYYKDFSLEIDSIRYPNKGNNKKQYALYKIFRCGLVHEYFIKGNYTVIANSPGGKTNRKAGIYWLKLFDEDKAKKTNRLVFNTNNYWRDMKAGIESYFEELLKDKLLQGNFENSLKNLDKKLKK